MASWEKVIKNKKVKKKNKLPTKKQRGKRKKGGARGKLSPLLEQEKNGVEGHDGIRRLKGGKGETWEDLECKEKGEKAKKEYYLLGRILRKKLQKEKKAEGLYQVSKKERKKGGGRRRKNEKDQPTCAMGNKKKSIKIRFRAHRTYQNKKKRKKREKNMLKGGRSRSQGSMGRGWELFSHSLNMSLGNQWGYTQNPKEKGSSRGGEGRAKSNKET